MDRFVPTAGDTARYGDASRKDVLEYKLVYGAMMSTSFSVSMDHWHVQGLYVITPSGKLIAGANTVLDPAAAAREMDKGLERYVKMSKEERLLPKAPDPARDRIPSASDDLRPPADGLILRMVSRGLPCEGVKSNDTRHEFFYKLDRVWYTQKEARAFVPTQFKMGEKAAVRQPVVQRLALLYLGVYVQPNLYWATEDVKEATLTTEITAIKEDSVEVRFAGHARIESSTNKRKFDADLLGKATFKLKTQTFSAFDLLAIGNFTLGPLEKLEDGAPRMSPMGVLFTLNGKNANDQVAPSLYRLYSSGD